MDSFAIKDTLLEMLSLNERDLAGTDKVHEFDLGAGSYCYIKRPYKGVREHKVYHTMRKDSLVIHPNWKDHLDKLSHPDIEIGSTFKSTNLRRFPRVAGSTSRFGLNVSIHSKAGLKHLVGALSGGRI